MRLEKRLEQEKREALRQQQQHDIVMQDKRIEEKHLVLNIKQVELQKQADQHMHELEMQKRRYL